MGEVFEQTAEIVNPKKDNVELWSLTAESGLTPKTERYNREFLVKKDDVFKAVPQEEFIYNPMNMTLGAVDMNMTGKKVAVSGYYTTMRTTLTHSNKYFAVWLKSPNAIKLYKLYATGSLTEKQRVQFSTLAQIATSMPMLPEQTAIGEFFRTLDAAIALRQRKLDGLRELKKAYLQQMFPQAGERVPRLRFAGFSGEWQERRLGDIAEFNPRSELPDEFEYVDLESVVDTSLVAHRTENKATAPSRAQRLAKEGDIFFQTVRPYQQNNFLFDLPFDNYVFSTGYAQLRPNIDNHFLFCLLQEKKFVSKVLDNCTGTSYPAINSTALSEIIISIALDTAEQAAIGVFFQTIDKQIIAQQMRLEQMEKLKSAYLGKMFI